MKLSTCLVVLSTLVLSSAADPIPVEARPVVRLAENSAGAVVHTLKDDAILVARAPQDDTSSEGEDDDDDDDDESSDESSDEEEEPHVPGKLHEDLWEKDGNARRYWGWAKLSYDAQYNQYQQPRRLQGGQNQPWAHLVAGDSDSIVYGFAGPRIRNTWGGGWRTFTGMKTSIAIDNEKKAIILSFMGTSSIPTVRQDLKFLAVAAGQHGIPGFVETGFLECFTSVRGPAFAVAIQLANANKDFDIVFTGHSLGGATAQIAALAWARQYKTLLPRTTVFTYGAPRAGNLEFQEALESDYGLRMGNFQHKNDLVPFMPPIHFSNHRFANSGNRWIYDTEGDWTDKESWKFVEYTDIETSRIRSVIATARGLFKKFGQHTQYFSENAPRRRSIEANDTESYTSPIIEKRQESDDDDDNDDDSDDSGASDSPSEAELETADNIINHIWQSNALTRRQVVFTKTLQDLTVQLHIVNEQRDLLNALNDRTLVRTAEEKAGFLKAVQIVAAEQ